MKKILKIASTFLAVIMILSATSISAYAKSFNTVQTADPVGIGTTPTTFQYGYYNGEYVYMVEKFFSFTPSYTGYYEFSATGYENTAYEAGYTPSVSLDVNDATGKDVVYAYTNEYTLKTLKAAQLQAGQTYYIDMYDNLSHASAYRASEKGYVEQTINLTIAPHSHTLETTNYSTFNFSECIYCDYTETDYNVAKVGSVSLGQTKFTYNGQVQTPSIIATDTNGNTISSTAYTYSITGDKKSAGKYTVTITFGSQYSYQTYSLQYVIVPKATSISKLSAKKKGFTVKWKKQATSTNGYAIRYSTKSNMKGPKTVYVSGKGKTSKTISGLKKGKKYYVQVATYTNNGGRTLSKYSKAKSVKVK